MDSLNAHECSFVDKWSLLAVLFEVAAERWIRSSSLEEAALPKNERDECEKEQTDEDADDDDPDGNGTGWRSIAQFWIRVRLDGRRVVGSALVDVVHGWNSQRC